MNDRLDRLESKIDTLLDRQGRMEVQVERNATQLEIHIESHRTLKNYVDLELDDLAGRLTPLETDRAAKKKFRSDLKWWLTTIAGLIAIIAAALKLL